MYNKEHQRLLSKYKRNIKITKYEDIFANKLNELNIKYIRQKGFLKDANSCYIADFYLPKPNKIVIEIDGQYHQQNQLHDWKRDYYFKHKRGIKTVRFKNEEVNTISLDEIKQRLFN